MVRPAGNGAYTVMRYRTSNQGAAVAYNGKYRTFVAGFPFETILEREERDMMMAEVLKFLIK